MNSTHPSTDQRARFRRGDLAAEEILAIDDHLASCQECRTALRVTFIGEATDRWQQALQDQKGHATYEEIEAYVMRQGSIDERTQAEDHFAVCPRCKREVEDLRAHVLGETHTASPAEAIALSRRRRWIAVALPAAAAAGIMVVLLTIPRGIEREPAPRKPITRPTRPPSPPPTKTAEVLRDGERTYAVVGGRMIGLPSDLQTVADRILDGSLPSLHAVRLLNPPRGGARGGEESNPPIRLSVPVGVVVEDDRPLFAWTIPDGAEWSRVEVFDTTLRLIAASEESSRTRWRPAEPFIRGGTYLWQIRASRKGTVLTAPAPPLPPARFKVISAEAEKELRAARASGSGLVLGLLYAREGMFEAARGEFEALAAKNPENELPRTLAGALR